MTSEVAANAAGAALLRVERTAGSGEDRFAASESGSIFRDVIGDAADASAADRASMAQSVADAAAPAGARSAPAVRANDDLPTAFARSPRPSDATPSAGVPLSEFRADPETAFSVIDGETQDEPVTTVGPARSVSLVADERPSVGDIPVEGPRPDATVAPTEETAGQGLGQETFARTERRDTAGGVREADVGAAAAPDRLRGEPPIVRQPPTDAARMRPGKVPAATIVEAGRTDVGDAPTSLPFESGATVGAGAPENTPIASSAPGEPTEAGPSPRTLPTDETADVREAPPQTAYEVPSTDPTPPPLADEGRPSSDGKANAAETARERASTFDARRPDASAAAPPASPPGPIKGARVSEAIAIEPTAAGGGETEPTLKVSDLASQPSGFDAAVARSPAEAARAFASPKLSADARSAIGDLLARVSDGNDGSIEIALDPPELGKIRVIYTPSSDGLAARVFAQDPSALELLRRHGELLAAELRDAGFGSVSMEFSREDPNEARNPRRSVWSAAEPSEAPAAAAPRPRTYRTSGLDLRV